MTACKKKDIILIPFPFSELTSIKKRPALVLANINHRNELICLMLTSTKSIDSLVDISISNLSGTGLPKPTVARTSRLFTINTELVIKKLGELDDKEYGLIIARINELITL